MTVALVGVVDSRGWLLLQERDERAPVNPEKWSLVGGGVEPGETPAEAARRELLEETGLARDDLAQQIVFVDPERIADLDLTDSTRFLYQRVLSS